MAALSTFVEVKVISAIKLIETVKHVLAGMGVHNIQENGQSQAVGSIDELLQLLGRSVARTGSKEVGYLVTKR